MARNKHPEETVEKILALEPLLHFREAFTVSSP